MRPTVQVLVASMNQKDYSLIEKLNLRTEAIIINQCDNNKTSNIEHNGNNICIINTEERGLSRSRNMAIQNATGDICLLCDDDVLYVDNYEDILIKAFATLPQADIIVFNFKAINGRQRKDVVRVREAPKWKYYCSVRIAFRLDSIKTAKIKFDSNFGAGSLYGSGEEAIMLKTARSNNLKIYEYPAVIASVDSSNSTWYRGFDEKFFYDKGAQCKALYGILSYIYIFYFAIRCKSKINFINRLNLLRYGIKGYSQRKTYKEYCILNKHKKTINEFPDT